MAVALPESKVYIILTVFITKLVFIQTGPVIEELCMREFENPAEVLFVSKIIDTNLPGNGNPVPCHYNIVAPLDHIIQLNFTLLAGLNFKATDQYEIYEGTSSCLPRIEISEYYNASNSQSTYERYLRTLCQDNKEHSFVQLLSRTNHMVLSFHWLASKHSLFILNFSFVSVNTLETNCVLECHGQCISTQQRCNGQNDCASAEDEMNCSVHEVASLEVVKSTGKGKQLTTIILPIVVLSLLLCLLVVILLHARKRKKRANRSDQSYWSQCSNSADHRLLRESGTIDCRSTSGAQVNVDRNIPHSGRTIPANLPVNIRYQQFQFLADINRSGCIISPPNMTINDNMDLHEIGPVPVYAPDITSPSNHPPPPYYNFKRGASQNPIQSHFHHYHTHRKNSSSSNVSDRSAPPPYEDAVEQQPTLAMDKVCSTCHQPTTCHQPAT